MRVALLLTLDPGLEREVEEIWEGEVCLTLDSPSAVENALHTLEDRPLLLVDTTCFPPPADLEVDILCLGEEAPPGLPLLERPLRKAEFQALTRCLSSSGGGGSSELTGILPSPFSEFQRDAVHDLNNQLTTLQGNLLLFQEEMDDPAVDDMTGAAAKAVQLTQWLEWLGQGEFSAEPIDLQKLLEALVPLCDRLRERKTAFSVVPSNAPTTLHLDPQKLLCSFLVLIQSIPGTPDHCSLQVVQQGHRTTLVCEWSAPLEAPDCPDVLHDWLRSLQADLHLEPGSWSLSLR